MGIPHPRVGAAPLLAAAALLAGCGGSGGGADRDGAGGEKTRAVATADFVYEPSRAVVPQGTTVSFADEDAAPHTATSKQAGAFDTGTIRKATVVVE